MTRRIALSYPDAIYSMYRFWSSKMLFLTPSSSASVMKGTIFGSHPSWIKFWINGLIYVLTWSIDLNTFPDSNFITITLDVPIWPTSLFNPFVFEKRYEFSFPWGTMNTPHVFCFSFSSSLSMISRVYLIFSGCWGFEML